MPSYPIEKFGGGGNNEISRIVTLEEEQVVLLRELVVKSMTPIISDLPSYTSGFGGFGVPPRAIGNGGGAAGGGGGFGAGLASIAGAIGRGFSRMSLPDGPSSKQMATAAREAMKKGGEALKLYGQLEATRSDPNMLATEKTAANIEATFSAMTLGVGNGFLQQAFNQSGFTDVRAVANKTYSEVMQAAEASFEMGAPLTQEEINQRASIRYQRNTIRKTAVRDRVLEAVDAVSREDADRTLKSALYDEKNLGEFTNAVDKFGSFVDMLYEKGVEVPLKYWMGP